MEHICWKTNKKTHTNEYQRDIPVELFTDNKLQKLPGIFGEWL